MFLALAGLTVIDCAAAARRGGDETAVIILAGVIYSTAYLGAGLATMRRRRWGWILGVLLGIQGLYVGEIYLRALATLPHRLAFVRPLLLTGGVGIVILVCLLTPAAIRFFWGRTEHKQLPLAATLIPPA